MRSRNIKPGFFKNEYLAEIEPLGRLLFEGLWVLADREGRLQDRPRKIWAEVLPYDNYNGDELLWQLHDRGFIVRYEVGPRRFIWIPTFLEHQNPHQNEVKSVLPDVSVGCKTSRLGSKSLLPLEHQGTLDSGLIPGFLGKALSEGTSDELVSEPVFELQPEKPKEDTEEKRLALQYAPGIHKRHVARKCSLTGVVEKLTSILRKTKKGKLLETIEIIDKNHQKNCESDDWTKDGGQFCPSLEKWLNIKQQRYLVEVVEFNTEARAGPVKVKSKLELQREEAMLDVERRLG